MIICDLCGESKDCRQREIEGREYDICSGCWNPFAQRLKGKGRTKNREVVLLPPRPVRGWEDEAPKPHRSVPPIILGETERTQ